VLQIFARVGELLGGDMEIRFYGHEDGKDPDVLIGKRLLEDNTAAATTREDRMVLDLLSQYRPFGSVLRQNRISEIGRS
jgi:hypothetical protein